VTAQEKIFQKTLEIKREKNHKKTYQPSKEKTVQLFPKFHEKELSFSSILSRISQLNPLTKTNWWQPICP
jgi:hypothetical protein